MSEDRLKEIDIDIRRIQNYIKDNHEAMFEMWSRDSGHGYYGDSI